MIKINKDLINNREIFITLDEYISNGHWAIKKEECVIDGKIKLKKENFRADLQLNIQIDTKNLVSYNLFKEDDKFSYFKYNNKTIKLNRKYVENLGNFNSIVASSKNTNKPCLINGIYISPVINENKQTKKEK
jgi:hypothetical protein